MTLQERFPLWCKVRLSEQGRTADVAGPRNVDGIVHGYDLRRRIVVVDWFDLHHGRDTYLPDHLERVGDEKK